LHSKRANIYYLEHCRVLVNGGRVEYVTEEDKRSLYWNIPIANTTTVLLGTGTSITKDAMREFAKAGVLVGFCGGGGTPLYSGLEVAWFSPQSEYRPTEYLQGWVSFWFTDQKRLEAAKVLQIARVRFIQKKWKHNKLLSENGFNIDPFDIDVSLEKSCESILSAQDTMQLLTIEAKLTKQLYRLAGQAVKYGNFVRTRQEESVDSANRFLDYGNYLAYGLGATATWVLGLPHELAVLHGKTRRGGLVFDAADLIKDALVLPLAFVSAMRGDEDQEFRQLCLQSFIQHEALDFIIGTLKEIAINIGIDK
jgi:CRISPR-associated protein Cas1